MDIKLTSKVIKGDRLGRQLGFPTANLDRRELVRKRMKIKLGVYAGMAKILPSPPQSSPQGGGSMLRELDKGSTSDLLSRFPSLDGRGQGRVYKAAIVIGPLYKKGLPKIEAHLIGFKGNLYGKKIVLELKKYLRPFRKFKDVESLKEQIGKDVERINRIN